MRQAKPVPDRTKTRTALDQRGRPNQTRTGPRQELDQRGRPNQTQTRPRPEQDQARVAGPTRPYPDKQTRPRLGQSGKQNKYGSERKKKTKTIPKQAFRTKTLRNR